MSVHTVTMATSRPPPVHLCRTLGHHGNATSTTSRTWLHTVTMATACPPQAHLFHACSRLINTWIIEVQLNGDLWRKRGGKSVSFPLHSGSTETVWGGVGHQETSAYSSTPLDPTCHFCTTKMTRHSTLSYETL